MSPIRLAMSLLVLSIPAFLFGKDPWLTFEGTDGIGEDSISFSLPEKSTIVPNNR